MHSQSLTGSAGSVLGLEDRSRRRGEPAFKGIPECRDEIVDYVLPAGYILLSAFPFLAQASISTLNAIPASFQFRGLAELRIRRYHMLSRSRRNLFLVHSLTIDY